MAGTKEAVVLIHGAAETEQGRTLDRLLRGMEHHAEAYGSVKRGDEADIAGLSYVPLAVTDQQGLAVEHPQRGVGSRDDPLRARLLVARRAVDLPREP